MQECDVLPGNWCDAGCCCMHYENHTGLHECEVCHVKWYDDGNEVW